MFLGGFTNSKEGFQQNTTQAFAFTFASEEDLDYFVGRLPNNQSYPTPYDADHDAFKLWIGMIIYINIFNCLFFFLTYRPVYFMVDTDRL